MRKVLKILILVMLIILLFQINSLYALYKTGSSGSYESIIGNWNIKVNGTQIGKEGNTIINILPSDLNYFDYAENDFVVDEKIAPGKKMYAYIKIDASNTDVAVIYDINIRTDNAKINGFNKLKVSNIENYYEKNGSIVKNLSNQIVYNTNVKNINFGATLGRAAKYTAVLPLEMIQDIGCVNVVKIEFEWNDLDTEVENERDSTIAENILDVEVNSVTDNVLPSIPIEISFKQYTGEDL